MSETPISSKTTNTEASARPYAKLGVLASLYFAQGLPFGYFTLVMPNLLRDRGASLTVVGLSQAVAFPWALKFLWAPLVDRHGLPTFGRRKSWIIPLQAAMTSLLVGLAFLQSTSITLFVVGVLIANFLAATQDIATDGLAIDVLTAKERGFANGVQVSGYRAGMVVGGSVLVLLLVERGAWAAFGAMAVLLVAASVPVLFLKEKLNSTPLLGPAPTTDVHFFRTKGAAHILGLVCLYKLGDAFATGMVRPFLKDIGFNLADQALLIATYGSFAGMAGALIGGALLTPLGRKRGLVVFGALQILTAFAYVLVALRIGGRPFVYAAITTEHVVSGMATAALFATMMDFCRPHRAATDYTVQASTIVIAGGIAQALSGVSADLFGFVAHFSMATVLTALSVPAVYLLYRPNNAPRAPHPPTKSAIDSANEEG